ncbi:hypothetical protein JCM5353_008301 [Sporobolomyces roseus]
MTSFQSRLESSLSSRKSRGMLRQLAPLPTRSSPPTPKLIDFSSNDYLSFSTSPLLRERLISTLSHSSNPSPYGPPSSRLLDGNTPSHLELEKKLESFFRSPVKGGLLFNSGFDANVGVWSCLPSPEDYILFDSLVHASIHDGMRSSRVPKEQRIAFKHNDLASLEGILKSLKESDVGVGDGSKSVWIGVESLYSMDGDLVPLREMVELVERLLPEKNGLFIIDEAHSTGLYGEKGRGLCDALGLNERMTVRVHTFGKAMACSGAVVLTSPLIRNYLINYARPLIYSTVMPHMNVKAIEGSIDHLIAGNGDSAAAHVHHLAQLFISLLTPLLHSSSISLPSHLLAPHYSSSHLPTSPPQTSSIIPLLTSSPRPLATFLQERGYLVRPITYPTVPKGMERVRVCLHAGNSEDDVEGLVEGVRKWVEEERIKQRSRKEGGVVETIRARL